MNSIKTISLNKNDIIGNMHVKRFLAKNYGLICNSHDFFHSNQLSELKASIASIISETKQAPESYLEHCKNMSQEIFLRKQLRTTGTIWTQIIIL